ncbi:MAG: DUF1361 domain-containing protein [Gemmatimonadaceae bacterium]|nr:DUF1361 domain-containing protein [Chitinophagaceae bacterium]
MTNTSSLVKAILPLSFLEAEINRLLILSSSFGASMIAVRIVYTGELHFLFLIWNLFLAFIPYFISWQLLNKPALSRSNIWLPVLATAWLLFIPNSFYILTDLFHLFDSYLVPKWFDLILIISFAWNALLMGILSVRHIEKIIDQRWKIRYDWLFVFPVMCLNALGVYIGRYMRFNSWDIVTNPFALAADILQIIFHPLENANAWAMIVSFSFLLSIFYFTLKMLSKKMAP